MREMENISEHHVFFLDDDKRIRDVVRRILEGVGVKVSCFGDSISCMSRLRTEKCSLLITDLKMPDSDGIEVLRQVRSLAPWVPVLLISGYGDVSSAVRAMKAGAVDFIEKPLDRTSFILKITSLLSDSYIADSYHGKPLSHAEKTVLGLVIEGKSSKEIARQLHRSVRTIEGHRSHLMHKLRARNLMDLVRHVVSMGLIDAKTRPELLTISKFHRAVG